MQKYMVNSDAGNSTVVLIIDGEANLVNESNPNYTRIMEAYARGDVDAVLDWLDGADEWFDDYLDDEDYDEWDVDDDEIPAFREGLSATIERYRREGKDATNLVRFMERLSRNPSRRSRDQVFNWTQARDMAIDNDGFIIGFKGVRTRESDQDFTDDAGVPLFPLDRYPFMSAHAGHGIVDGIEIENGHLPMGVGVTVEIPRHEVQDDPAIGCHVGLHVGTYDYAKGYSSSGALLEVRFDPADVVSVPSDAGFAKLRCCSYTGIAIHEADGNLDAYEPEATDAFDEDQALDAIGSIVEGGFWSRVVNKIRGEK